MIFKYKARDPMGRYVDGEMDVDTPERLKSELEGRALKIIWYEQSQSQSNQNNLHFVNNTSSTPFPEHFQKPLEFEDEKYEKKDVTEQAKAQQKNKGCSMSFGVILFIIYVIYQIMQMFK